MGKKEITLDDIDFMLIQIETKIDLDKEKALNFRKKLRKLKNKMED